MYIVRKETRAQSMLSHNGCGIDLLGLTPVDLEN